MKLNFLFYLLFFKIVFFFVVAYYLPKCYIRNIMDFFEGTEKLLELWFTKANSKCTIKNDLRNIPREELEKMLDLVNCKILSTTQTRDLDSYVLSESSLFVAKHRVILKTCGTTRLLNALPKIIELATIYAGFDAIEVLTLIKQKKLSSLKH